MLCPSCDGERSERKFCTSCGKPNANYDHANDGTEIDVFHDLECSNGHPVLKQVQHIYWGQPFCPQCGTKLDDETIRALYYQCDFFQGEFETESKRFLSLGYDLVVATIEDYCGGIEQDQDSPTGASTCTGCLHKQPGHGNDPYFNFMAASTDSSFLDPVKKAFKSEPTEPWVENDLVLLNFSIEKENSGETYGMLIKRLIAAAA